MKKLLGIVVLGLLWCNVGFAETKSWIKKKNTENPIHEIVRVYSLCYAYFKLGEEAKVSRDYMQFTELGRLAKLNLEDLVNKSKITNKEMTNNIEQGKKYLNEAINYDLSDFPILEYTYNDF